MRKYWKIERTMLEKAWCNRCQEYHDLYLCEALDTVHLMKHIFCMCLKNAVRGFIYSPYLLMHLKQDDCEQNNPYYHPSPKAVKGGQFITESYLEKLNLPVEIMPSHGERI